MTPVRSNLAWLGAGTVLLLLSIWLGTFLIAAPAPAPATSDGFSAETALTVLERLAGPELPHPIGTEENHSLRARIVAEFSTLGFDTSEQPVLACREQWAICGFVTNVVARWPGSAGQPSILMTAHYDSVGAGPGIADDLAGVAALLEVARLTDPAAGNPLLFVITDGEEVGLLGAEGFTLHEAFADVAVVVNVEARGTSGQSMLFETNEDNAWIVSAFAGEAPSPLVSSLHYELYRLLPNDTDFSVYREAGLQGLNFAAIGGSRHYHTPLDNLDNLSPATLQHHGENLLAAARALQLVDLTDPPAGDSVYLSVVPGYVFQLPTGWAFYLALASLVLWFVASARLLRTGQVTSLGLFFGAAFPLAAILLAAVLGQSVSWLLPELTGQQAPWWSQPLPALAAMGALAVTAVLLAGLIAASRSSFWGIATGVWFWFALAAFLLLEWLPGASVVFLVPATALALLFGLTALSPLRDNRAVLGIAAGASLLIIAAVWLPLALNLETALGLELGAGVAACFALASLGLMPFMAVPAGQRTLSALLPQLSFLVAAVAFVFALRAPLFSEEAPQLMDILHLETAVEGESESASWLLDAIPAWPLPSSLTAELVLSGVQEPALPWSGWNFHRAEASGSVSDWPHVTVLASDAASLRLRLESPRGGQQLHLFIPAASGIRQLQVGDSGQVIDYSDWGEQVFRQFSCYGPECSGLVVELLFTDRQPFDLLIADQVPGLPAGGAALQTARGPLAVAWQDGDVSLAVNRQSIRLP